MKNRIRNFDIQTKLGSGSYGVIYKALNKSTREICVLKQISLNRLNQKARKSAINQATIMGKLVHPFIVRYQESFIEQNTLNIVMEYCDNGDLNNYLKMQNKRQLKQQKIWRLFLQICIGLQYIHKNKILHRDIKTLNIFMNKNEQIKIGDLGVAKMLTSNEFAQTMVGTPFYLSPQLCQEKPYNQKSDIWALGCLLYELCTYRHPFEAQNQASLILKIIRGKYAAIPELYSKELKQIIDLCLERDYKRRPSASNILARPKIQEMIQQFGISKIIEEYSKKVSQEKQTNAPIRITQEPKNIGSNKEKVIKAIDSSEGKKIGKALQNQPKKDIKKEDIKKQAELPKRQQPKKQQIKREPIVILPKPHAQSQKKIQSAGVKRSNEQYLQKRQNKNDFMNNLQKMIDNNQKAKKIIKSTSNYIEQPIKQGDIRKQERIQKILQKVQQIKKDDNKNVQIIKSPSQFQTKRVTPSLPEKKNYTPSQINSAKRQDSSRPPIPGKPPMAPNNINNKQPSKQGFIKVKNEKIVQPKVYQSQKNVSKPSGIIKSGGFHSPVQPEKQQIQKVQSHSKQKISYEKIHSAKRYSNPAMKYQKEKDQPKQLFGPSPSAQHKSDKIFKNIPSAIAEEKKQPKKQEAGKISRVRKGSKNEFARNAKNVSRYNQISKEQEDMVINLPTNIKGIASSDSEEEQPKWQDKNRVDDIKVKTNKTKFKLKEVNDQLVLQKYQDIMKSQQSQYKQHDQNNISSQSEGSQALNHQFDRQIEEQTTKDNINQREIVDNNEIAQEMQYARKNSNQPIEEALQEENLEENLQKQLDIDKQFQNQDYVPIYERQQWSFDEEPELPLLEQKQSPDFEQNNPYLMEQQQQQTPQNKINYLQIKLQQNMKRQDEINKLMQLKIDECRKFIGNEKSLQQIFGFFRKKLQMDDEYSENDEKQVQVFLKKKGLIDQNKFQNIYKIMHFQMELENTRNIIQRICKKLSELDQS